MSWQPAEDPKPGDRFPCDAIETMIIPRSRDIGGFGSNHHLQQSLVFLNVPATAQPEVYLGDSASFASEGVYMEDGGQSAH
jgi:hypothetical protein